MPTVSDLEEDRSAPKKGAERSCRSKLYETDRQYHPNRQDEADGWVAKHDDLEKVGAWKNLVTTERHQDSRSGEEKSSDTVHEED